MGEQYKKKAILYVKGTDTGDTELQVQSKTYPNLRVQLYDGQYIAGRAAMPADGQSPSTAPLTVLPYLGAFNGSTWDRVRNNTEVTLLASATRTATTLSPVVINYNARGVLIMLRITARTVGTSPLARLDYRPYVGDLARDDWSTPSFDPIIGYHNFIIYPSALGPVGTETMTYTEGLIQAPAARRFDVRVAFVQDITDLTYSLKAVLVL